MFQTIKLKLLKTKFKTVLLIGNHFSKTDHMFALDAFQVETKETLSRFGWECT